MCGFVQPFWQWFSNSTPTTNENEQRSTPCTNALKDWTGKSKATILYDTMVDEFTDQGLFDKVNGKPNVALIVFTEDGDVFGVFYDIAVNRQRKPYVNPDIFLFCFESHGRCETPKKFCAKCSEKSYKHVMFYKNDQCHWIVAVGWSRGSFIFANEKTKTQCYLPSFGFEGIDDDTFTGKRDGYHTCVRLVEVHFE